ASVSLARLARASSQSDDSFIRDRSRVNTTATIARWANTMRAPSMPSGARTRNMASTATGPRYQSTCATPLCLPRASDGAISAISDQEAGMSAPTGRTKEIKPTTAPQGPPGKTHQQCPRPIKQHVILINLFAPEEIAKSATDESTQARRDGVRTEGAQHADERVAEVVGCRPQ